MGASLNGDDEALLDLLAEAVCCNASVLSCPIDVDIDIDFPLRREEKINKHGTLLVVRLLPSRLIIPKPLDAKSSDKHGYGNGRL